MLFVAVSFAWDNEKILHVNISQRNLIFILGWGWLIWNYTTGFTVSKRKEREVWLTNVINGIHMVDTLFMALFSLSAHGRFGKWMMLSLFVDFGGVGEGACYVPSHNVLNQAEREGSSFSLRLCHEVGLSGWKQLPLPCIWPQIQGHISQHRKSHSLLISLVFIFNKLYIRIRYTFYLGT